MIALAIALFMGAGACYLIVPNRDVAVMPSGWWAWVITALLFGLSEYTVFNVHFRRHGISFNLSEIPIAIALVYLAPGAALLARLPLAVPVFLFVRKNQPYKLAFNVGLGVFEMSLSILLFRWFDELIGAGASGMLVSIALALLLVTPLGSVIISLAISRFEGGLRARVVDEIRASWWMYTVNAVLAVMVVALMLVEPALALIAALPAAGIWWVLQSYGDVAQELRDLDDVHGFAGRIGRTLDVGEIGDVAAAEMATSFRSAGSVLVRFTGDTTVVHVSGHMPVRLPDAASSPEWLPLVQAEDVQLVTRDDLLDLGIDIDDRVPAALIGPVRDETGLCALAVVAQAPTYGHQFDSRDVARLQNMVEQLAVSLRRGLLHERLEFEARHDALTGLPARTLFERHVGDAVVENDPSSVSCVLMLDLDRFKEVNDTLGHHAGDDLLIQFAGRMSALLEDGDVLARLAGDEFAILCRRPKFEAAAEFARTCVVAGGRPVILDGLEIVVTVSVGVAEITPNDHDAVQPMRRADIAMYNAKWQRTGVELYRDEIDRRTPARLSMLGDLRAAIESEELDVVYQPKLSLSTGRIVGVEALVRWEHASRGVVPPMEFVRVAEDTGLIKDLTDLVLGRGIAMLREFQDAGLGVGLAVNLSTHDLFDARLPVRVHDYLMANGVTPEALTLEITESSLFVDAPRTRATIDELHAVGLRMAVDDFGTGYSSLSYLRRLPVHELKIDQSFVAGMLHDPQDEVIVRSTVDLGHNLDLAVVAEGVESIETLDALREMGCDVAQGFCIAQPIKSQELLAWLHRAAEQHDVEAPTAWLTVLTPP